jgi:RNA polymerase sigma factor (sigma-70 family)
VEQREKQKKFEQLVLRHMDSAFNLARWLTRNQDAAKDLTQEAMLRAFKAFDRFEGEDARAWLFTIIRNLYYTSVTRKPEEQSAFDENLHSPEESTGDPETLLLRNVDAQAVRKGIEELPEEFRVPLVLRELEGLSYREIAAVLEIPLGTVMSRLARARNHLRQTLARLVKPEPGQKGGQNAVPGK